MEWPEYNIAAMIILALDTSSGRGRLALTDHGRLQVWAGSDARTHGEQVPQAVVAALAGANRRLQDVDLFAVVSGPGSFTGLRVGIACVQGWAMAGGKPALGIPTLDCVLATWLTEHRERAGDQLVVPCVDGQRGDVFFSAAHVPRGAASLDDCAIEIGASVARPDDLRARIAAIQRGRLTRVVGEGDRRGWAEPWPGVIVTPLVAPIVAAAARIAADRQVAAGPPHALQPLYIRRPDAELARDRARARQPR
jgi:tRNA threonylcarbamoyladenosine biosynthesis protein TsaB